MKSADVEKNVHSHGHRLITYLMLEEKAEKMNKDNPQLFSNVTVPLWEYPLTRNPQFPYNQQSARGN